MRFSAAFRRTCALLLAAVASPATADAAGKAIVPLHSFKMMLVDSTPQGTSSRKITYVAPDMMRLEVVGSPMVVVAIAKDVWLRGENGQWQKAAYGPGVDPLSDVRQYATYIPKDLNDPSLHLIGPARLNGALTDEYSVASPPGVTGLVTRIWIGHTDGYPHQIQQRKGAFVFTAIYSAWNQPLSVSAR